MKRLLKLLREPVSAEKRDLLKARWAELPTELQVPWQAVGRHHVHCGYTLGPAYCSFGCTHCYLPRNANQAPLPTLQEMKAQIEANRRMIGEAGGLQITGGDVVDAYWRAGRGEELVEILRYANEVGSVPMLMTHGQVLLENPDYLARLVTEGGLRKLSLHIDITQAGRPGFPIRGLKSEVDLHPLRERFVDLILDVRRRTGIKFFAAQTVTVTERNIESVGEIFRWLLSNPRHLDVFRMVSLQPEAAVGRTRSSGAPVTPERSWRELCAGVGLDLSRDNLWFGHPDCSHFTTLLVLYPEGRIINLIASDQASREYWSALFDAFEGVGARGASHFEANVRRVSLIARRPSILWKTVRYAWQVMRREGLGIFDLLGLLGRDRLKAFSVVQHNFMGEEEIAAPRSEVVEKRLAACCFRGAVEREGEWVAVPMCAMNGAEREALYAEQIAAVGTSSPRSDSNATNSRDSHSSSATSPLKSATEGRPSRYVNVP